MSIHLKLDHSLVESSILSERVPESEQTKENLDKGFFSWILSFFHKVLVNIGILSKKEIVVIEKSTLKKEKVDKIKRVQKAITRSLNPRSSCGKKAFIEKPSSKTKKMNLEKLISILKKEVQTAKLPLSEAAILKRFEKKIKKMSAKQRDSFKKEVRIFIATQWIAKCKENKSSYFLEPFEVKAIKKIGYKRSHITEQEINHFMEIFFNDLMEFVRKESPSLVDLQAQMKKESVTIKLRNFGIQDEKIEDLYRFIAFTGEYREHLKSSIKDLYEAVPNLPASLDRLPIAKAGLLKTYHAYLDKAVAQEVKRLVSHNCETIAEKINSGKLEKYLGKLKKIEFSDKSVSQFYAYASKTEFLKETITYYEKYMPYLRREMAVSILHPDEYLHKGVCFAYAKRISIGLQKMRGKISVSKLKAGEILPEDRLVQARQILISDGSKYFLSGSMLKKNGFKEEKLIHKTKSHLELISKLEQGKLSYGELNQVHEEIVGSVIKKIIGSVGETDRRVFDIALYMPGVGHQVSVLYDPENQTYGYVDSELGLVLRKMKNEEEGVVWIADLVKETISQFWHNTYMAEVYTRY